MNINVILFGQLADVVGKSVLTVNNCYDTESIKKKVIKEFPALAHYEFLISIDKKIARNNQKLEGKNEIAFLPPFAGG